LKVIDSRVRLETPTWTYYFCANFYLLAYRKQPSDQFARLQHRFLERTRTWLDSDSVLCFYAYS
jgi:hypothetical protein